MLYPVFDTILDFDEFVLDEFSRFDVVVVLCGKHSLTVVFAVGEDDLFWKGWRMGGCKVLCQRKSVRLYKIIQNS